MTRKSRTIGMRNAILRNYLKHNAPSKSWYYSFGVKFQRLNQTAGASSQLGASNLLRHLHDEFNVKSIGLCQVSRRHFPECIACNFKVIKLHLYLKAILEPIPYCLYWRHRGFWNSREKIYLPDGVHLNDLDNLKLFRSIQGAVIKAYGLVGL